jgi:hypothetical protein
MKVKKKIGFKKPLHFRKIHEGDFFSPCNLFFYSFSMYPKGGELLLIILKSEEIQMEDRMYSDAQIDAKS